MATPTYATVISQINTYIVANANNEITANVLNPILKVITDFANNTIGELTDLTTTDTDTIVGAINSLKIAFENLNNNGIQLSTGYTDPNVTPPSTYGYGDFYMELDISDDSPIQLWQWNGTEWTTYSSVYTKAEIDYLLSNYYTKSELLTQIGLSTGGQNELIEKGFNHVENYDWFVFAQVYRFNGVITENLVTDTITLDAAPATLDFKRFDVIVFNDNFTFSVVKGDEGLNPAIPKIDIKTQIQLTVILVEYGTTEPSYVTKQLMYDEGVGLPTEFAVTKTGTTITINSLEQPSSGTKSIKVANPINSDVLFLDKNVTFNSLDVDTITFKVKNGSAGNWRFYLYSYNSIDGFYQGTATIKNGSYGYSSNNITSHQTIIVPISKILGTGEIHNTGFAMTFYNSSLGTFYFDEFALNGNFTQPPELTNPLTYLELTDTDNSYAGHAGKVPKVNVSETALAFENLTKSDVGLGNVDNTSDVNKPVSIAQQTALDLKLNTADYNQHFRGVYLTLAALNIAHPTAVAGDYAQVNETGATDVLNYNWDTEENVWIPNAVAGSGATNTDQLPEGTANLYFTTARVLNTLLTGISFLTGTAVVATDSILVGFGKLQKQISDAFTAIGTKQDTLVSGTNIKTINSTSLLGSGDIVITGGARVYNVKDYGAKGDGIDLIDGGITTGTNIFTSASAVFSIADVGKVIAINGAGTGGNYLVTTISGFTNVNTITLSVNASITVSGVIFYYGTDDTTFIQSAINDVFDNNGGVVYVPNGVYVLNGVLQNNIGTELIDYNSQLYIPYSVYQQTIRPTVKILGETPPSLYQSNGIGNAKPTNVGVIFRSSIIGSGVKPSVIASDGNPTDVISTMNYTSCNIESLQIQITPIETSNKMSVGGISFSKAGSGMELHNITVFPYNIWLGNTIKPTIDISAIELGIINNEHFNSASNVEVGGFTNGFVGGEHVYFNNCIAVACFNSFVQNANYHQNLYVKISSFWCVNDFVVTDNSRFKVESLQIESQIQGKWYDSINTILDNSNFGNGEITLDIVQGGIGVNNSLYKKVGGNNLRVKLITIGGNINLQTGTTYVTKIEDASRSTKFTNATAITVTVPLDTTVNYDINAVISGYQGGAGQVTFVGAVGVTINTAETLKLRKQNSAFSLIKESENVWLLTGDLQLL